MCGILGGNNPLWDYEKGIRSLYHRGPDGQRVQKFEEMTLAFARLAIIDLSANGMQPMTSADGNVSMVYNGEIYGYGELKESLEKKYRFYSTSDTEVILNAYLEYGDAFIEKIDGIFAIAIYDRRERQLKLYRDRVGVKPLYYYCSGKHFAFASELKALKAACTDLRWEIDHTALYDYLFYGYIPDPKTLYQNCYKLPPAHTLVYDLKSGTIRTIGKYWKLHVNTASGRHRKDSVLCDELRTILARCVRQQMVADVPVGCFLSGGVDSSIVTYECSRVNPQIHAYTIGFEDKTYNESEYADMMTDRYRLNRTIRFMGNKEIDACKGRMKEWYDEPFADTSAYPTYTVSQMAKEDVTVVLTGDGGDELFGGYKRHRRWPESLKGKYIDSAWVSRNGRRLHLDLMLPEAAVQKYINTSLENLLPMILLTDLKTVEKYRIQWKIDKDYDPCWYLKQYDKKELPPMTRARYLDFKTYLPGDVLTKVDRVSMANSLEARVPLLAREMVEFAFSLSEEECFSLKELKRLFKKAYEDVVPRELLYRGKMGFSVPQSYLGSRNVPITCKILQKEWGLKTAYKKEEAL